MAAPPILLPPYQARRGTHEDIHKLLAIEHGAYPEADRWLMEDFARFLRVESGHRKSLVAEKNGTLLGFVCYEYQRDSRGRDVFRLENIAVSKPFRHTTRGKGCGVGTFLVRKLEAKAKLVERVSVTCEALVNEYDLGSQKFFHACNWRGFPRRRAFGDGRDGILFRWEARGERECRGVGKEGARG